MRTVTLAAVLLIALSAPPDVGAQRAGGPQGRPDLSGTWGAGRAAPPDPTLVARLPPGTAIVPDAGAPELPAGNFGGLKPKPAAAAAAAKWDPRDEMTISRVCLPPSIVYSMQGPFPMEIHQADELIVMRLE